MNNAVYFTHPATGTVHMVGANVFAHAIATDAGSARTMCGTRTSPNWEIGDETVSGIAATCGGCRRFFGLR